jgi:hypothetical protein
MLSDPRHAGTKISEMAFAWGFGEISYFNLVSRFQRSQNCAAHSDANFGIKGTLATLSFQCPF